MAKCKNCTNLYNLSDENDVIVGKWCPKINDSPDIDCERNCEHYKCMTKGDRIRSMSDEELAGFIEHISHNCLMNALFSVNDKDCKHYEDCESCIEAHKTVREWLQSEVEES